MALDEPEDGDISVESGEFKFLIEEGLSDVYGKFTIDYNDGWMRKGFTITPDRGGSSC